MSDKEAVPVDEATRNNVTLTGPASHRRRRVGIQALVLLVVFVLGGGSGYILGDRLRPDVTSPGSASSEDDDMALMHQVNPPDGYMMPVAYGDVGPQLVASGAIDMIKFSSLYQQQNLPLTDEQMTILTQGTQEKVNINPGNAYFLLNFFWALGLANQNSILTEGAMVSRGADKVGGFASTGGWTLGKKAATDLYAKRKILVLTVKQQAMLEEVAGLVYRPCCNNPTDFPDCNHGMAMLGLLELMASQNATADQMYEAAKYVTAFWYPQQMLEVATAIKAIRNLDFVKADAREVVSNQYASGSGFQAVHQWLSSNGLLKQAPSSGGSCGVQ